MKWPSWLWEQRAGAMSISPGAAVLYSVGTVERNEQAEKTDFRAWADAALAAQARAGDMAAFEVLVRRYRNDVFRMAYHVLLSREDAWDVSQEVFIKAYQGLRRFRGEASFKTWLLRITLNHCKDFFKKRRLRTVALDGTTAAAQSVSPALGPRETLSADELGRAIGTALDSLSAKHRTAFVLREFEGMSYDEMARTMGCRIGTVMSRLHHARKNLQESLIQMGFVEGMRHD